MEQVLLEVLSRCLNIKNVIGNSQHGVTNSILYLMAFCDEIDDSR